MQEAFNSPDNETKHHNMDTSVDGNKNCGQISNTKKLSSVSSPLD